jgi:Transposase DDE domain.
MNFFKRIRILDSTGFGLPSNLEKEYKGSNGAALKIQLEYDLVSGNFLFVTPQNGIVSDRTYGSTLGDTIEPGDLFLRDLGYFSYPELQKMEDAQAFFISRIYNKAALYLKNDSKVRGPKYIRIDLAELMDGMEYGETREIEGIYAGYDHKMPVRLIVCKLTEEQTKKRMVMREKKEKKKGVTYTPLTKKLASLNMYITNIPETIITKHEVFELYTLRWQVEILFKTWKSIYQLHAVKRTKLERFQCHLYGTLLSLIISSMITFQMRFLLYKKKQKEASEFKIVGIIKEYLVKIQEALFTRISRNLMKVFEAIYEIIEKNGRKSRRYKKKTVFDILRMFTNQGRQVESVA